MGVEVFHSISGGGASPVKGQMVSVHCTGYIEASGVKFWSTKDPGQKVFSFKIGMGRVIKGWDEGVAQMKVGGRASLVCSPDFAYGAAGFPAWGIPPNAVLRFEIELLRVD